jgi:hypothetical protein
MCTIEEEEEEDYCFPPERESANFELFKNILKNAHICGHGEVLLLLLYLKECMYISSRVVVVRVISIRDVYNVYIYRERDEV